MKIFFLKIFLNSPNTMIESRNIFHLRNFLRNSSIQFPQENLIIEDFNLFKRINISNEWWWCKHFEKPNDIWVNKLSKQGAFWKIKNIISWHHNSASKLKQNVKSSENLEILLLEKPLVQVYHTDDVSAMMPCEQVHANLKNLTSCAPPELVN